MANVWKFLCFGAIATTFVSLAAPAEQEGPALSAPVAMRVTQPGFAGLSVMQGTPSYYRGPLGLLHYWSLGDGPAIILMHQSPMFAIEFAKAQPLLAAQGFRVIAIDIPGFGLSQRPDHPATADEYTETLRGLLDSLGIKSAVVVGNHTGSTLAMAFALRYPKRTRCQVLWAAPVYSAEELKARLSTKLPDTTIYSDGRQLTSWWQGIQLNGYGLTRGSPELMQWLLIGSLLAGDLNWYGDDTNHRHVTRTFDAADALRRMQVPTFLINAGDSLAASMQRAHALRPDFQYLEVAEAYQHTVIAYDHPKFWADTVGEFIREHCGAAAQQQ
jgi:pimeloyl-ACP methyl ester carboxylesterase